ncbi:MAG: family 10 glycosylhydrolase [Armatimonadetes bacterium]|nr:family 10 glycosylhydrolase [Armatimonadota bacterium]MDW8154804.1 alpha amylase family protein [Armatimonadota bacterium]
MRGRTLLLTSFLLVAIAAHRGHAAPLARVPRLALWIEPGANLLTLSTREGVRRVLDRAKAAGVDTVVFEAKNAWGYVTYPSRFAPVLSDSPIPRTSLPAYPPPVRWLPRDHDLLGTLLEEAHARGLRVFAAVNTFSEGLSAYRVGPAFDRPEWIGVAYVATRPVQAPDGSEYEIDGANATRYADQLILYTRAVGTHVPTTRHGVEVVVRGDRVREIRDRERTEPDPGPASIPEDGYVLAGHGRAAAWLRAAFRIGDPVGIGPVRVRMEPGWRRSPFAFVNPAHPEVRLYELAILHELLTRYPVDGVILDRTRYEDLTQDFSERSRRDFEAFLGRAVVRWPEDIYRYVPRGYWVAREPGPLYRAWLGFRARNIYTYVLSATRLARALRPGIAVGAYVGGWYPVYYEEGANWAHPEARPPYPWASEAWARAGYAPLLDFLMVGLYYRPLTVWEALRRGANPIYSVEGGAMLARELVLEEVPVVASLYLPHFSGSPGRLREALRIARAQADGIMLFDLIYLTDELWEVLPGR